MSFRLSSINFTLCSATEILSTPLIVESHSPWIRVGNTQPGAKMVIQNITYTSDIILYLLKASQYYFEVEVLLTNALIIRLMHYLYINVSVIFKFDFGNVPTVSHFRQSRSLELNWTHFGLTIGVWGSSRRGSFVMFTSLFVLSSSSFLFLFFSLKFFGIFCCFCWVFF